MTHLEQDEGRLYEERPHRVQDEDDQQQRQAGVHVPAGSQQWQDQLLATYFTQSWSSTNHIMRAEMITITEPRASAMTCRNTPGRLVLDHSSHINTAL